MKMYMSKVSGLPTDILRGIHVEGNKNHGFINSRLFGSYTKEEVEGKVKPRFRVEAEENGARYFVIQSNEMPESDGSCDVVTKEVDYDCIQNGWELRFKVRINAVKAVKKIGKKNNTDIPIKDHEGQVAWFMCKCERSGCEVISMDLEKEQCVIGNDRKQVNTAMVKGILRVTNEELFKKALRNGVGGRKNIGFGLLSVWR